MLLILSQDGGFITAAQSVVLPSVPWYKERVLQKISLGGLLVVVLVHVVKFNLVIRPSSPLAAPSTHPLSPPRHATRPT